VHDLHGPATLSLSTAAILVVRWTSIRYNDQSGSRVING